MKFSGIPAGFMIFAVLAQTGSATEPVLMNPSFDLSRSEAAARLKEHAAAPRRLPRPLLIAGGFADPFIAPNSLRRHFEELTVDSPIITVSFAGCVTFDQCADRLIAKLEKRYPGTEPGSTCEVDAIGFSMGGIALRHAATQRKDQRRLKLSRLFTFSTPHQGSDLAEVPALTGVHYDLRTDSTFLARLNRVPRDYQVFPYSRLRDSIVAPKYAALPGESSWWVQSPDFSPAHFLAFVDKRLILDIYVRLTGEPGYSTLPRVPPPVP